MQTNIESDKSIKKKCLNRVVNKQVENQFKKIQKLVKIPKLDKTSLGHRNKHRQQNQFPKVNK